MEKHKSAWEGENFAHFRTHTKKYHKFWIYKFYYDANLNLCSSLGLSAVRYLSNLIYRDDYDESDYVKDKIHEISLLKMTCNKGKKKSANMRGIVDCNLHLCKVFSIPYTWYSKGKVLISCLFSVSWIRQSQVTAHQGWIALHCSTENPATRDY